MNKNAEPALKKHMDYIKSEMVWDISQQLAEDRLRRRDERIAEARAAPTIDNTGGLNEVWLEEKPAADEDENEA